MSAAHCPAAPKRPATGSARNALDRLAAAGTERQTFLAIICELAMFPGIDQAVNKALFTNGTVLKLFPRVCSQTDYSVWQQSSFNRKEQRLFPM